MCCLVLGADEIEGRALGFCLEQFFKLVQVQVLAGVTRGKVLCGLTLRRALGSTQLWCPKAEPGGSSKARRSSLKDTLCFIIGCFHVFFFAVLSA